MRAGQLGPFTRLYQLIPVYSGGDYDVFPVPPDTNPGDIMLIVVGEVSFYRCATVDEPRELVYVNRTNDGLETPDGWVRVPPMDGERALAEQGWP